MSKSPFSPELRAKISQAFLSGEASAIALASKYGVGEGTITSKMEKIEFFSKKGCPKAPKKFFK